MNRWIVRLESEERSRLEQLVRKGKAAAYKIRHANVLLAVDESGAGPGERFLLSSVGFAPELGQPLA